MSMTEGHPMERSAAWTVLLEQGFFEGLTGDADRVLTTWFLADFRAAGTPSMWEFAETWKPAEGPVMITSRSRGSA